MKELIEALEAILQKGIVVEPIYVEYGVFAKRHAYRILLADEERDKAPEFSTTVLLEAKLNDRVAYRAKEARGQDAPHPACSRGDKGAGCRVGTKTMVEWRSDE